MGDRVSFTAYVREENARLFANLTGFPFENGERRGRWMMFEDDQVDGGGETECKKAAESGCEFFAVHGMHSSFPGAWMAGHEGKFYLIVAVGYQDANEPMVPVKIMEHPGGHHWELDQEDIDYVLRGLKIIQVWSAEAKVTGFGPPLSAPRDFAEEVAGLIASGLEDEEILEYLDPDTAGTDLIALVRKLMLKKED